MSNNNNNHYLNVAELLTILVVLTIEQQINATTGRSDAHILFEPFLDGLEVSENASVIERNNLMKKLQNFRETRYEELTGFYAPQDAEVLLTHNENLLGWLQGYRKHLISLYPMMKQSIAGIDDPCEDEEQHLWTTCERLVREIGAKLSSEKYPLVCSKVKLHHTSSNGKLVHTETIECLKALESALYQVHRLRGAFTHPSVLGSPSTPQTNSLTPRIEELRNKLKILRCLEVENQNGLADLSITINDIRLPEEPHVRQIQISDGVIESSADYIARDWFNKNVDTLSTGIRATILQNQSQTYSDIETTLRKMLSRLQTLKEKQYKEIQLAVYALYRHLLKLNLPVDPIGNEQTRL